MSIKCRARTLLNVDPDFLIKQNKKEHDPAQSKNVLYMYIYIFCTPSYHLELSPLRKTVELHLLFPGVNSTLPASFTGITTQTNIKQVDMY